jgi:multiple RNA-binding domain-containing protein 1
MSRLIVKGLPPTVSEAQLRAHFARHFSDAITDVKIARKRDGKARQFAFLGFRGGGDAAAAAAAFHRTFLGASRLSVEVAKGIGEGAPAPPAVDGGAASGAGGGGGGGVAPGDPEALAAELGVGRFAAKAAAGVKDKALLAEYLAASRSRATAPTWANDDALTRGGGGGGGGGGAPPPKAAAARARSASGGSDEGEYQELPGAAHARASAPAPAPAPPPGVTAGDLEDLAFLRSKMAPRRGGGRSGEADAGGAVMGAMGTAAPAAAPAEAPAEAPPAAPGGSGAAGGEPGGGGAPPLADTGRLFLRNLPYVATEGDLRAFFLPFGAVADVALQVDGSGRSKGLAYVTFVNPEAAVEALAATDGRVFLGRLLHVLPARAARGEGEGEGEGEGGDGGGASARGSSSFKRSREEARKRAAVGGAEAGSVWNTLFVRSDAAVAAAAAALGVARGELLDRDASNLAVRAALAETQVVADTKRFLEDNGVCLPTLEVSLSAAAAAAATAGGGGGGGARGNTTSAGGAGDGGGGVAAVARSATTILVKNLPPDADAPALRDMFSRHGALSRFLLPPARVLCLVEYSDAKAAKRAFAALAYARFQRAPLYLEWAPEAIFVRPAAGAAGGGGVGAPATAQPPPPPPPLPPPPPPPAAGAAAPAPPAGATTLFVKNLAFSSTEEGLRGVFAPCGTLRSVRIPRKRGGGGGGGGGGARGGEGAPALSLGYGFVEFAEAAGAAAALRTRQGAQLDGHALELRVSRGGGGEGGATAPAASAPAPAAALAAAAAAAARGADAAATKLMVRNLAFEATKRDLTELFSAFGTLKTVRLPKKFDGTGRGFAFVEFITHAEARAAMAALAATHLYGRHLVIEWAAKGDGSGGGAEGAGAGAGVGAALLPAMGKRPREGGEGVGAATSKRGATEGAAGAAGALAKALAGQERRRREKS